MNRMTDIYWNVILNFYEEKYACHITHVLPSGNIEYEFNPNCADYYRTVKNEEDK